MVWLIYYVDWRARTFDQCYKPSKEICGLNGYFFINAIEIYKFKANDPEIHETPLSFGNASKDFSDDNMKSTGLNACLRIFSWLW